MSAGQCRVCGGEVVHAFEAEDRQLAAGERFAFDACEACGGLQLTRIPADLDRFYPPDYYTRRSVSKTSPSTRRASAGRRAWTALRLRLGPFAAPWAAPARDVFGWLRRTGTGLDDPILEVGCGDASRLRRLHRLGCRRLTGIDPRLGVDPLETPELRLRRESLEGHAGRYPLVMAHHSFEHMADPKAAFEAFARLVPPGGWLLLRVPRADGWARCHYGAHWVQLDAPRHTHVPTRKGLESLAARSGFSLRRVVDDSGPFQIWGSEAYRRGMSLEAARLEWRQRRAGASKLGVRLRAARLRWSGLGDQACFYFERI